MKKRQLIKMGVPKGDAIRTAIAATAAASRKGMSRDEIWQAVANVVAKPENHVDDETFGAFASVLVSRQQQRDRYRESHPGTVPNAPSKFIPRDEAAPWRMWGRDLDPKSIEQLEQACSLPIAQSGALMPDAHLGYGLPIGGVLATRNAVIPYAVGVDIACRMKMTVLDLPPNAIDHEADRLTGALLSETRFGVGASFRQRREHRVMDEDWRISPVTAEHKDKAWSQLGTSGSGNHFAEFGILNVESQDLDLKPGPYLALLSHSGSRGVGNSVATHYSRMARRFHPELPRDLSHLAWLALDTEEGQEYWLAMELMGRYASANHELLHRHIARALGAEVLLDIENHHNFAWKERHHGEDVIVHRKGATPAAKGVIGIIPGSMATPGFIVRGKGHPESLDSASHGAGRAMSRTQAKKRFTWKEARKVLDARGVTLLSAGLDEVPMVYKDIENVMAAQTDLVEPLARFDPRLVKMAPAGERPED